MWKYSYGNILVAKHLSSVPFVLPNTISYSKKDISEYMIVFKKEKCIISFDGIFAYYYFNLMSLISAGGISNFI